MSTPLQFSRKYLTILIGVLLIVGIALPFIMPATVSAQTTPTATGATTQQAQPTVCSGGWFSTATINPVCWFRATIAGLSAIIIQLAIWVLIISGTLFNLLVDHTIINFGQFLYGDAMKNAVETAWEAFRDISNIVIIGMFVFVAVSIILGSETFGQRKMVAKIIVIAVLINFSLLFTKVIIDFSNFAALQFYNAAALQATDPATAGDAGSNKAEQKGISGAFLNYMGVTGIGDSYAAVKQSAESNDSGGIALLHGIAASIFILAAAIVLFYGSFLLASRGILLIFLLLTSSIAFATYLIPISAVNSKFGWSTWWNSLLKSAVFAPLLMIFLWVTLAVGKALKDQVGTLGSQNGTLGDLMSNPTKGANLEALFGYIIVLGLLFISFKISASFSTSITGFNYAAMLPASIAGIGAQLGGFVGRRYGGGLANRFSEEFAARARNMDGKDRSQTTKDLYSFGSKAFGAAAKSDMNVLRNSFGGQLAKTAGMKLDTLTGPKIGGFVGQEVARAKKELEHKKLTTDATEKERAEFAAQNAKGKADKDAVRAEALKEALQAQPKEKAAHDKAKQEVELSKDTIRKLQGENSGKMESHAANERQLRQQKADAKSQTEAEAIEKQIKEARTETARYLKERNQGIREATAKSRDAARVQGDIERRITGHLEDSAESSKGRLTTINRTSSKFSEALNKVVSGLKPITTAAGNFEKLKKATEKSEKRRKQIEEREKIRKNLDDKGKPVTESKEGGEKH